jgi:hypothetical protein
MVLAALVDDITIEKVVGDARRINRVQHLLNGDKTVIGFFSKIYSFFMVARIRYR